MGEPVRLKSRFKNSEKERVLVEGAENEPSAETEGV